jgi:[ribosomal protein S5]-alanine N-acetyltransferase
VSVTTRLLSRDDVPVLAPLIRANREFLAPWDPLRSEDYFTDEFQATLVRNSLAQHEAGSTVPHVILLDGEVVGRITLSNIVRGPFQSTNMGYWVARSVNGRGVATAAVAILLRVAFLEYQLHRVEAGTLVHNVGSQRVLERNGFMRFGLAPRYLQIAGEYQDHVLFQRLADD